MLSKINLARATGVAVVLALLWLLRGCLPGGAENPANEASRMTPVRWLDEARLLVRQGGIARVLVPAEGMFVSPTPEIPPPLHPMPALDLQPRAGAYRSGTIDFSTPRLARSGGFNQGFPTVQVVPFLTWKDAGATGLVTFDGPEPRLIPLRTTWRNNTSAPVVVWDGVAGRFLAYQSGCEYPAQEPGTCRRTAWWLNPDLTVMQTFSLPHRDILHVPEHLACFSCGCGCYTREEVHAVGGTVWVHIAGFPLPTAQRGLYRVVMADNGSSQWQQVVQGRMEPPLAFSPSGCQVAWWQVSDLGDTLRVTNLCQD